MRKKDGEISIKKLSSGNRNSLFINNLSMNFKKLIDKIGNQQRIFQGLMSITDFPIISPLAEVVFLILLATIAEVLPRKNLE